MHLETLMYYAPFYRHHDPSIVSKMDEQYEYNVTGKRYAKFSFENLHNYLTAKIQAWLRRFPHKNNIDSAETADCSVEQAEASQGQVPPECILSNVEVPASRDQWRGSDSTTSEEKSEKDGSGKGGDSA